MKATKILKAATAFAIAASMSFAAVGCGSQSGSSASSSASSEARVATAGITSDGPISLDLSGLVYDANDGQGELFDVTGTDPVNGWEVSAERVQTKLLEDADPIDKINVTISGDGVTIMPNLEGVEVFGSELYALWCIQPSATKSPTFVASIGNDEADAKTVVFSYIPTRHNVFFWTADGPCSADPFDVEPMEGVATAFDGKVLTVGGKEYRLETDYTIVST